MCVGNICVSGNLPTIVIKPHLVAYDEFQHHHLIHEGNIKKKTYFYQILKLSIHLSHHPCPCLPICYSSSGPPIAVQLDVERLKSNL